MVSVIGFQNTCSTRLPVLPAKDPAEIVSVILNWQRLCGDATITQIEVDFDPAGGLGYLTPSFAGKAVAFRLSRGTVDVPVVVTCSVILSDETILRRSVVQPVIQRGDVYVPDVDDVTLNTLLLTYAGYTLPQGAPA
jgi:hypothetical protein